MSNDEPLLIVPRPFVQNGCFVSSGGVVRVPGHIAERMLELLLAMDRPVTRSELIQHCYRAAEVLHTTGGLNKAIHDLRSSLRRVGWWVVNVNGGPPEEGRYYLTEVDPAGQQVIRRGTGAPTPGATGRDPV